MVSTCVGKAFKFALEENLMYMEIYMAVRYERLGKHFGS